MTDEQVYELIKVGVRKADAALDGMSVPLSPGMAGAIIARLFDGGAQLAHDIYTEAPTADGLTPELNAKIEAMLSIVVMIGALGFKVVQSTMRDMPEKDLEEMKKIVQEGAHIGVFELKPEDIIEGMPGQGGEAC